MLQQLHNFKGKASNFGIDGFLIAIIGMIVLAFVYPFGGSSESPVPLAKIANYGVSVIFFFYGLKLNPEKLKAGLSNWKLHLMVHFSTFVLFPLLVLLLHYLFPSLQSPSVWLGIFYLAALPSTVSSSVVMVSIAKGNIPAAIFNASISSLLGIFITPLWMEVWMNDERTGQDFPLGGIIIKLFVQILLPVILGFLLHQKWGSFAEKHHTLLKKFDQSIILIIVYTAFCESFSTHIFDALQLKDLASLYAFVALLFFAVFILIIISSRLLGFNREDRITCLFCGSKKSLVHGTVMSKVLFPLSPQMGIILLPIMLYHAFQLIVAGFLANKYARES
ncbi:bile acid:sodium symporter family protein [Pedobacter alpinus]|uniref:Bile acid:sodium symporter family protein n=1 Tax=Pedobacter alpinus TaxID=1590643 RepID=A0ABW5TY55_9SPHI